MAKNKVQKRGFSTSFGVTIKERTFAAQHTRYQFNGKEYDNETETSDFGARNLDGDLGVWGALDPMIRKYPSLSPYNYTANNPILFIDVNGEDFFASTTKNQKMVIKVLNKTFGRGHGFEFDDAGKLNHHGIFRPREANKAIVFDYFKDKIVENSNVTVNFKGFNKNYFTSSDGTRVEVGKENAQTAQKVDASGKLIADIGIGYEMKNSLSAEGVITDKSTAFWHEVGHPIATVLNENDFSDESRSKAARWTVGFENIVRNIFGMENRSGSSHGATKGGVTIPGSSGADNESFDNFDIRPDAGSDFKANDDVG